MAQRKSGSRPYCRNVLDAALVTNGQSCRWLVVTSFLLSSVGVSRSICQVRSTAGMTLGYRAFRISVLLLFPRHRPLKPGQMPIPVDSFGENWPQFPATHAVIFRNTGVELTGSNAVFYRSLTGRYLRGTTGLMTHQDRQNKTAQRCHTAFPPRKRPHSDPPTDLPFSAKESVM